MSFTLKFTETAIAQIEKLDKSDSMKKRAKAVKKALGYLSMNPKHPSLNTHEFTELTRQLGFKVFEAYAENNTPGAYRIFWRYGEGKKIITILSIEKHPNVKG